MEILRKKKASILLLLLNRTGREGRIRDKVGMIWVAVFAPGLLLS
jgi:hypothetical protein